MACVRSSCFIALCRFLAVAFGESVFGRIFRRLCAWVGRKWDESWLCDVLYREGALSRAWGGSTVCRILDWLLNLPLRLLQWLYRVLKAPLDSSFFATVAFRLGAETAVVACWLIAVLTSIHQEYYKNAYMLVVAAVILLLVYVREMRNEKVRFSFRAVEPYAICFAAMVVFSILSAEYFTLSARYISYYAPCMILVIALIHAADTQERLLRVGGGLAIGVGVTALYGLYQFFIVGVEPSASYTDLTVNAGMPGRVYSLYDNPNALGAFLLLTLPIVAALLFSSRKWYTRVASAGVLFLGLICIVMTYSRTSWIGLVVAAAVYIFFWKRSVLPYCVLAGLIALPLLPTSVLNRILSIGNLNDTSTSSRFILFSAGWSVFADKPLTGVGLGADAVRKVVNLNGYYAGHDEFIHAHNMILQIGAEMGIFGIISFLGSVLGTVSATARAVRDSSHGAARHIAIGGTAALVGSLVYGLADYLWTYPRVMFVFWFVFGLTLAAIQVCRAEAGLTGTKAEGKRA